MNIYAITESISNQLARAHFRVRTGEQLGAQPVRFIASKTIFVPAGLFLLSANVVAQEQDGAKPRDIDSLFDTGFKLAKRMNRVPLPRGLQFGYLVMPMIIGKDPDSESLLYAASGPDMPRWCLHRFPIVVDLTRYQVVFFEGFKKFGAAIWPSAQKIVIKHIEPLVDELVPERQQNSPTNTGLD